jgi:hypothetical protein
MDVREDGLLDFVEMSSSGSESTMKSSLSLLALDLDLLAT